LGNDQKEAGLCCYPTADGLLMLGAFNRRQHERLWHAFDRPDFAAKSNWEEMAEFGPVMRQELSRLLAEKTASEWESFFHELGIPAERVRTIAEALTIADTEEHPFTAPIEVHEKTMRVPAYPFHFSAGEPQITSPPPRMGEHTREVLLEMGYTDSEIQSLAAEGVI
jgi:crotonobetainyl-CoA:carnitine CoA-transferase CaiB-like acyl-CoA transferase